MIDFDHDDGHVLALSRGTPPLALEKFLEILLGVEEGDGIDGRLMEQLVLDVRQLLGPLVQYRFERPLAASRAAYAKEVAGTHEQDGEKAKRIGHSRVLV